MSQKSNCVHFSSKLMTDKMSLFIYWDNHLSYTQTHTIEWQVQPLRCILRFFDKKVCFFFIIYRVINCIYTSNGGPAAHAQIANLTQIIINSREKSPSNRQSHTCKCKRDFDEFSVNVFFAFYTYQQGISAIVRTARSFGWKVWVIGASEII